MNSFATRLACSPLQAVVLVFVLFLFAAPSWALDGTDIARHVDAVNRFVKLRNLTYGDKKSPVVILDRAGSGRVRVNTFERWRNNRAEEKGVAARDLVIFRSGKLRGTGILVTDYSEPGRARDYLLWLPSLRKLRRVIEPDPADRWGNSNFSYGDIYIRRVEDEDHDLLGREIFHGCLGAVVLRDDERDRHTRRLPSADCSVHGKTVFRLRSRPRRADLGYEERITWVDASSFADYRSEYYRGGQLVKVIDKSWRRIEIAGSDVSHWVYWYAQTPDTGQEGMAFVDPEAVSWDDEIESGFWSEGTLRRIKR